MAVPTDISALSTTAASNSPVAGDNVFPDLDDFLRITQAMLASIYANTATNGWVSPYAAKSEGTFTPVLKFGGATTGITYATQTGKYARSGNIITLEVVLLLTSKGSATGQATVDWTALPTGGGSNSTSGRGFCYATDMASLTSGVIHYSGGGSGGNLLQPADATGNGAIVTAANFTNTTYLSFSVTFMN